MCVQVNFVCAPKPTGSWSDIDIVGLKGNEVRIVECKEWVNPYQINALQKKFVEAKNFLTNIGFTKGKNVKFVLAQLKKSPKGNHTVELNKLSKAINYPIEHVDFDEMLEDILKRIQPNITKTRIGKFSEPITWMISRLVFKKWIGIPKICPHCSKKVYDYKFCYECGKKL